MACFGAQSLTERTDNKEHDIPDEYFCPTCDELLAQKVYQCANGHVICHQCLKSVIACPKCHTRYNGKASRVRVLENLMDQKTFSCNYKRKGCLAELKRTDWSHHRDICKHGGKKFRICEILGFSCNHEASSRYMMDALGHLERQHKVVVEKDSKGVVLNIEDPFGAHGLSVFPEYQRHWSPVILKTEDGNTRVILSVVTCHDDPRTFSLEILVAKLDVFSSVSPKPIEVEFGIKVEVDGKTETIAWKQEAEDIEHCNMWRRSQTIRFERESSHGKFFTLNAMTVECKLLVDGKRNPLQRLVKKITLTLAAQPSKPISPLLLL